MMSHSTDEKIRARETWGRLMTWHDFQLEYERRKSTPAPFKFTGSGLKLKYYDPETGIVCGGGQAYFHEVWYADWLQTMVDADEKLIFFLVVETTDVFELEWNFNEVAYMPLT
jgi:hypothetical protein